ncbi:MAG: hypothetical protein IPM69_03585 [Ignavibacteria bacterium]|nr:hypothetical protein [Ignavibacteria bacterium]
MHSTISTHQGHKKSRSSEDNSVDNSNKLSKLITPSLPEDKLDGNKRWEDLLNNPHSVLVLSEMVKEAKKEVADGEFDEKGWDE